MPMTKEDRAAQKKAWYEANKENALAKAKAYREENRVLIAAKKKEVYEANKTQIIEQKKYYYQVNKDGILAKNKAIYIINKNEILAKNKEYYKSNKSKIISGNNIYRKKRLESDPFYAIKTRVRNLISKSLLRNGFKKLSKSHEILGCDYETFKEHIESRFLDGMSWENRDEWHIDHIIPVSLAQDVESVITLNHYLNLRPLWAAENLEKSDKMPSMDLIKQYGADVIFNKLKGI
jgi:hypothetical protein